MIVQMKRLTLVAHKSDEQALLNALQPLGAVEVIPDTEETRDQSMLDAAQSEVDRLSDALTILKPYGKKGGLLSAAPEASLQEIKGKIPEALQLSSELEILQKDLQDCRSQADKNAGIIEALLPWKDFPSDMGDTKGSKYVRYFTGLLDAEDLPKLQEIEDITEVQIVSEAKADALLIACAESDAKTVQNYLKSLSWTDFAFPKLSGTPQEAIDRLREENEALGIEAQQLIGKIEEKSTFRDSIGGAYDAAVIERDRAEAATEIGLTECTFHLEGWVPEDRIADVKAAVESVTDAYYFDVRDPEASEIPPSVVRNSEFVEPFEAVTNLYSRPDPRGIDATPYMTPFYILLFGMMLSDTGYGLLLLIGGLLFLKLKKPTGMMASLAKVITWGGLSTIIWGFLTGTFFGLDFDVIFGTKDVFPLLVDPMSDPIMMLILCFGLGVLHILFGVALKIKMSLEQGDWQTAVFDNFSWILIIIGLIMFAGSSSVQGLPPVVSKIGLVLAIIGAVMILLFKGRQKKNVFSRTVSGLGELYQVTSYLSDILSYARLFALGIATGVIASVFNQLCAMLMSSPNIILKILGTLVACALLVGLHLFNLAINTLGAFVHCARLQYVEFYGKFYEAGGRTFQPLGYTAKHVRLTDK
ncbi:MAG: V-type ATP synthase subunit I [Clostridia bacterium]|nr:V-type ATP synthase subunit I [Clostridia bacterium]